MNYYKKMRKWKPLDEGLKRVFKLYKNYYQEPSIIPKYTGWCPDHLIKLFRNIEKPKENVYVALDPVENFNLKNFECFQESWEGDTKNWQMSFFNKRAEKMKIGGVLEI